MLLEDPCRLRLYAHELSVNNFLADNYGIINGASTFLYVQRETPRPLNCSNPTGCMDGRYRLKNA